MILKDNIDYKIRISDIETYEALSLFSFYNPDTDEWKEFEVSEYVNELASFLKFYEDEDIDYIIFFNGLAFDQQVIEWVRKKAPTWYDKTNLQICSIIAAYGRYVFDNQKHKVRVDIEEKSFHKKQLDTFKIWHFDREQRSTGLKKVEFAMDFPNIEELPIDPSKETLTKEEILKIREYCRNDIMATYHHFLYSLGRTEHSLYKGDNKIELRFSMMEEFGVSSLNVSDTSIGNEILRKEYAKNAKIPLDKLPKKGFFRKNLPIKYCIPRYVKFNDYSLTQFLEKIRNEVVEPGKEFKKSLKFGGRQYDFAKGGLHSVNKGEYYKSDDEYFIIDWDVVSYYPWIMINEGYSPYHLNREAFIEALRTIAVKRAELKPLAKKDKKIKGIVAGLKIAANSVYGFTSDLYSWIYDQLVTLQTCITGELSLLMLIEGYVEKGIEVISANTDGVTLRVHKDKLEDMMKVNEWWMNVTKHKIDRTDYEFIAFSTVNDYIALKTKGEIEKNSLKGADIYKVKGDFLLDSELHGDKSRRVVRLALHKYFIDGIPVEETIKNHKNIYDFCIGVKSSENYHYELVNRGVSPLKRITEEGKKRSILIERGWTEQNEMFVKTETHEEDWEEGGIKIIEKEIALPLEEAFQSEIYEDEMHMGKRDVLKKMVRYYISNTGKVLLKIKNPDSEAKGNAESQCESPSRVGQRYQPLVTYFNEYIEKDDYDINYDYYITSAQEKVDFIQKPKTKKGKVILEDKNQLSLF